ncbi:TnsA endonuclease N-terminal domain-containing protein [Psychrobacillus sp. FSL K6-1415]|uniref:TnsA endonuclease N-terminal domain-containing protein n=1 Tax=Psychrobacillus sp. FSL K6-1415 TaxID=2921544 RepID=UPI0030F72644
MSKRKNNWSEEKKERYIKEGRGQGELGDYIPWLKIQNVPSDGNVTRLIGWKTKRQHEFLSNLERDYFLLLEWADDVVDIREQFPLKDTVTFKIAEEKGIAHSIDRTTKAPIVMTTDFLITIIKNQQKEYLARTVKPSGHLEDNRVIEKFEIEREYWKKNEIDWGIVTEREISSELTDNILWIHKFYYLDDQEDIDSASLFLSILLSKKDKNEKVIEICNKFDDDYYLGAGASLNYIKHFLARKYILVDMNKKINVRSLYINELNFNISEEDKDDYISS